jgi:hypothetical protein
MEYSCLEGFLETREMEISTVPLEMLIGILEAETDAPASLRYVRLSAALALAGLHLIFLSAAWANSSYRALRAWPAEADIAFFQAIMAQSHFLCFSNDNAKSSHALGG